MHQRPQSQEECDRQTKLTQAQPLNDGRLQITNRQSVAFRAGEAASAKCPSKPDHLPR